MKHRVHRKITQLPPQRQIHRQQIQRLHSPQLIQAQQSAAVANGEVWKCTQTLNTPTGYQGGAIRLELIQEVNGEMTSTQVVDGEKLTFPYTLDITGAPGVGAGTLYVSEQINGTYQQLGQYPITFQKAE